jgi:tRNA threonylcarbamoyladenosine biosynthesis protein TsaE
VVKRWEHANNQGMPTFSRSSESLEHTGVIAKDFASVLRRGDLVRLVGEMGAGKTTFVRLVAEAMGVDVSMVSSPTFVLMNNYPCSIMGEAGSIAHLDCYRFGDADELEALGWDRVCEDGSVRLVEWPERIDNVLGDEEACTITISHVDEGERGFVIEVPDAWMSRSSAMALRARDAVKCPVTGEAVHPESASWPFVSERARMSDLHGWMNGKFAITRPIEQADLDQE